MKKFNSKHFSIKVAKPQLGLNGTTFTVVKLYKGSTELKPVTTTPKEGEYKISIMESLGCTVQVRDDKIFVMSISQDVASVTVDLILPNGAILKKYFSINKDVSSAMIQEVISKHSELVQTVDGFKTEVNKSINGVKTDVSTVEQTVNSFKTTVANNINSLEEDISEVEQTANKINWLVKSGTSSSNMQLSNNFFNLVSDNITLKGKNITLEGTTSINGTFKINGKGFPYLSGGEVGGFDVNTDKITGSNVGMGSSTSGGNAFWAGSNSPSGGDFYVTHSGKLVAQNAHIHGKIESDSVMYANGGIYTKQDIRGKGSDLVVVCGTGHMVIRSENGKHVYLQPAGGEVKVTGPSAPDSYKNLRAYNLIANNKVYANGIALTSNRDKKKNIEDYTESALHEICTTPIRQYHLEDDLDNELKRIGVIVQEAPLNAIDLSGECIDLYQMVSMSWKAIQELKEEVNMLKNKIESLENNLEL